jgi:hypothetical protein
MEHVSHQAMIMQFIIELSKSAHVDSRECVRPFFARLDQFFCLNEYESNFI